MFDGIYTGTETRDSVRSRPAPPAVRGLPDLSAISRTSSPGGNGGGWVDTVSMRYLDRYAEQLWVTLFAKAPEITLFDFRLLQIPRCH